MALNIGNINFGVDASTVGLQKAVKALEAFQKKTTQVARAQTKGAQQVAAAMSRQESAIRRAFQQTLNLQRQLRQAGVPPEQIARVTQAFKRLTTELTSGKLSLVDYNRAVDSFQAKMGRAKRSLQDFNASQRSGKAGFSKYLTLLRDLESSAVLALGPLSGLGARVRSLSAIFSRSSLKIALTVSAIAGLVIGLLSLAKAAITAGEEMKSLRLRFEAATGSTHQGRVELKAVIKIAQQLGLEVNSLAGAYSRFVAAAQGTSLEGEKARKVFYQVARAAAALKLSGAEVEGVMIALEQMLSKGTVQSQELKIQLGNRLPGAFKLAARAMGVTTSELQRMLEAGEIVSDEFLPKLGDAIEMSLGRTAEKNLTTLSGAFNLLRTNTKLLFADIDNFTGLSAGAADITRRFANLVGWLAGEQDFLADATDKANKALSETPEPAKVLRLTKVYTDLNKELSDSYDKLHDQQEALGFLGRAGDDIDYLLNFFEALRKTQQANSDELGKLAQDFGALLHLDIPATAEGVAAAFAEIAKQSQDASEAIERFRNAPEILSKLNADLQVMRDRVAALSQGTEAGEFFDKVTSQVNEYRMALRDTAIAEAEQNRLVAEYAALLAQTITLTEANAEAERKRKEALHEAAQAQERANRAIMDSQQSLDLLRRRVRAMSRGPDSLELFERVQVPLIQFRQRLEEAGVSQGKINSMTAEYEELLKRQFEYSDRYARAAQQMASAVTNGLEDIIIKSSKVIDVLKQVGLELISIWLRSQILDPLEGFLSGAGGFGGFLHGGGGKSFGNIGKTGIKNTGFATGGSFKLRGSGGTDNVPFYGVGKPGEVVSVARPDQVGSNMGGGGDIYITIDAPGADAGTIARLREIVRTELGPQLIKAATNNTVSALKRPRFA